MRRAQRGSPASKRVMIGASDGGRRKCRHSHGENSRNANLGTLVPRDTAQGESIQQEGGRRGAEEPQLSQQLVLEAPYWISTSVPIGTEA